MYRVRELLLIGILEKSPGGIGELPFTEGRETSRRLSHKSCGQQGWREGRIWRQNRQGSTDRVRQGSLHMGTCVHVCVHVCVTEGMLVRISED